MEVQDSNPREWLGVIGAGAVAALVTALAMLTPAQGEPIRSNGPQADGSAAQTSPQAPHERNNGTR